MADKLKFNVFTGTFDITSTAAQGPPGPAGIAFSITKVLNTEVITIPENREMLLSKKIKVDGKLIIDGKITILLS